MSMANLAATRKMMLVALGSVLAYRRTLTKVRWLRSVFLAVTTGYPAGQALHCQCSSHCSLTDSLSSLSPRFSASGHSMR
jgi:hypothetical protein